MGAAAAATVSKGKAVKVGKRYDWGSERPGVLERRVQQRKEQMPKKLTDVEERVARFRAAELAKVEEERLYLEEQEALLKAHRERLKQRKTVFRPVSTYPVDLGRYPEEEVAAVRARNPDADDEAIFRILSRKPRETIQSSGTEGEVPERPDGVSRAHGPEVGSQDDDVPVPGVRSMEEKPRTEVVAKAVVPSQPKPAPIHIEASVRISSQSDVDEGDDDQDWTDFDPEAWNEGDEFPRDRYERVRHPDGYYHLREFANLDEAAEKAASPEFLALLERGRELQAETDSLIAQYGHGIGSKPQDAIDRLSYLRKEAIAVDIQMEKLLDG